MTMQLSWNYQDHPICGFSNSKGTLAIYNHDFVRELFQEELTSHSTLCYNNYNSLPQPDKVVQGV